MKRQIHTATWWGPPKKFSTEREERKISWLELFYDLVYVIAIARITHHLAEHPDVSGMLDYTYFFIMIFWGWLNGSLYHDMHGSTGLRTSLMTLWQIMIVAALVVTLNSATENYVFNATIALMVMQLYITYLWWSVGIYDKAHRQLNKPYTLFYLASFGLMFLTLFIEPSYIRIIFYISLLFNYLAPFVTALMLRNRNSDFRLSSSMTERLGLFTIIIFGEVVTGVVNGVSQLKMLNTQIWLNFGLAILIVFSLWWLFFTLISDRPCKKGFVVSSVMELFYIPTLMSLGMIAVAFSRIFEGFVHTDEHIGWIKSSFDLSFGLFLLGINTLLFFLEYPPQYSDLKKRVQQILWMGIALFALIFFLDLQLSLFENLCLVLGILLSIISLLNYSYYMFKKEESIQKET